MSENPGIELVFTILRCGRSIDLYVNLTIYRSEEGLDLEGAIEYQIYFNNNEVLKIALDLDKDIYIYIYIYIYIIYI